MRVTVYVEGGGGSKELRTRCRRGFSKLFEKAGLRGRMPRVVACGSRNDAFGDFSVAVKHRGTRASFPVLLVDSEAPVTRGAWDHLRHRDGWKRPSRATQEQVHLMVQIMESWFLADASVLRRYFGAEFNEGALPKRRDIEAIAKEDVLSAIAAASRDTTKGGYSKGRHSFQILELVAPASLEDKGRTPHAKRLFDVLRAKCG